MRGQYSGVASLVLDAHPLLDLVAFETVFDGPLGTLETPPAITAALRLSAPTPLASDESVRAAVRALLRHGGYKPSGRGKPASEYLLRAEAEGELGSINLAVDVCNAASLHGGLPISVVDLDRARPPFRVGIAAEDASYVFNASGQSIRLAGLLCLHDAEGPCANAVRDSQRTKTHPGTTRTLSLVWGSRACASQTIATVAYSIELLEQAGARVERWDTTTME